MTTRHPGVVMISGSEDQKSRSQPVKDQWGWGSAVAGACRVVTFGTRQSVRRRPRDRPSPTRHIMGHFIDQPAGRVCQCSNRLSAAALCLGHSRRTGADIGTFSYRPLSSARHGHTGCRQKTNVLHIYGIISPQFYGIPSVVCFPVDLRKLCSLVLLMNELVIAPVSFP